MGARARGRRVRRAALRGPGPAARPACGRGPGRRRREPAHDQRAPAEHGGARHGCARARRRRDGGPRPDRRACGGRRGCAGHLPVLPGHAPVRGRDRAALDAQRALRPHAGSHPVLGSAAADLRRARARGPGRRLQGHAGGERPGQPRAAPARTLGLLPLLGGHGHGLPVPAHPPVPAAAHGRPAVPVPGVGGLRALRGPDGAGGHDRGRHRVPLGRAGRAPPGHGGDARVRRPGHARGDRRRDRLHAVPRG